MTKEADQITWAGSSDHKVDETTNKLSIVCWLTLYGAGVGIQFEVSVKSGDVRNSTKTERELVIEMRISTKRGKDEELLGEGAR